MNMTEDEQDFAKLLAASHRFIRLATLPVIGDIIAAWIGQSAARKIKRLRALGA